MAYLSDDCAERYRMRALPLDYPSGRKSGSIRPYGQICPDGGLRPECEIFPERETGTFRQIICLNRVALSIRGDIRIDIRLAPI